MSTKLFLEGNPGRRTIALPVDATSHRYRLAIIDPAVLQRIDAFISSRDFDPPDLVITVELFTDAHLDCVLARDYSAADCEVFSGRVAGAEESCVVMTKREDMLALDIWYDGVEYQVVPVSDDVYLIEQVNLDAPIECASDEAGTATDYAEPEDSESSSDISGVVSEISVNVLVIYESQVEISAGGPKALRSQIDLMVANLNKALRRSLVGTGTSVVVTLCGPLKHDFPNLSPNNSIATNELRDSALVRAWRNQYGADLVSLLRATEGTSAADILHRSKGDPSEAFSAVKFSQARQRHTFSHEIGHNFGCPHDKENARLNGVNTNNDGIFWGYNWRHKDHRHGTLMSYPGKRILYFSNPNVSFMGEPTGRANAFNAAAIAQTAHAVAKYRHETQTAS